MDSADPTLRTGLRPAEITAALAWWREAGVDLDFADEPTRWLGSHLDVPAPAEVHRSAPVQEIVTTPPVRPFGGDSAALPIDLEAFYEWWLEDPTLDEGQVRGRVAPRGAAGAAVMVIVPQPEAEDADRLLSGPEGRLLDNMLSAMGLTADDTYVASALPRHTPLVDWIALAQRGVGAVLAQHVGLVTPGRIIVFGSTILPLLGHDPTHSAQTLLSFNHEGRTVPLLAARDLGALLARPAWKAGFWREWLDWTGQSTA